MRDVFERLERLGLRHYVTGSEALARYAQPRQTMGVDVVAEEPPGGFERIARAFEDVVGQFRALHQAGRWSGFRRPEPRAEEAAR